MKFAIIAAVAVLSTAGLGHACPDWQRSGVSQIATSGDDLWSPNSYSVVAGGDQSLRACRFNAEGFVISRPDFEADLWGLESFQRLNIRVSSSCDTVLLINDSSGQWWYDDDSGNGLNASVDIGNPQSGVWDIWVGTYDSATCGATLTLETF